MRLVAATGNAGKLDEIRATLGPQYDIASRPPMDDPVEDGGTLLANARIKARAVVDATGEPAIADDTGLFVDALGGAPGIKAGRYAGEKATYADNRKKLQKALEGVPAAKRTARFRCVIALARPGTILGTFEGQVEGRIVEQPRGSGEFGYDPLFLVPELGKTLAEIPAKEKNKLSHRARALEHAKRALLELI